MNLIRALLCIFLPPLAVLDKGCGTVLLVCVLTMFGWIPGALAALVICAQQTPPSQPQLTPQPHPYGSLPLPTPRSRSYGPFLTMALVLFVALIASVYTIGHKIAGDSSPNSLSNSKPAISSSATIPPVTPSPAAIRPSPVPATAETQREAVRRFPELGIPGSKFNKEFLSRYSRYKQERPDYFTNPAWPIRLAEEVSKSAGTRHQASENQPVATPARTGRTLTIGGYFASPSEEFLDKASAYSTQQDSAALSRLLASGFVIQLKAGIPVEVVDTNILSGKLKIRPIGQTVELWTVIEAIKEE